VAVVTGASSGIGLATARALADAGALLVVAARPTEKLEQAAGDLGSAATAIPTDVTSAAEVDDLLDKTIELHGRIDILIANAGIYAGGDFVANDVTQLLQLLDTNVGGVVRTIHAALKYMIAAGTGDIVVTSSVSGHQSIHWEPVYSASKHAVQALTHALRRQLIGTGVRIGAVAPGVVLNDLWQVTDAAAVADGVAAGTGLTSEDVAEAIVYSAASHQHPRPCHAPDQSRDLGPQVPDVTLNRCPPAATCRALGQSGVSAHRRECRYVPRFRLSSEQHFRS
jgi:ribitol 2-dehydrogenase